MNFRSQTCLGAMLLTAALHAPLSAAPETELKDEAGKTIIRYVVEAPASIAPAGVTDPVKQVGLFLCFPEHDRPTGDEILPVRQALKRLGLSEQYVLLAGHPQGQKFSAADDEPITKLIAWAKKTYPINPRRVYMYGKGEGGKISGEFAMLHPELVTASITYSWGWWRMPTELGEAIDPLNKAPEFYMVLGLRDLSHHITTVRDTYSRVRAKGHHVIYREFDDLGARTYHPASNDDAIAWATRLRNKNIAPSHAEAALLKSHPAIGPAGYYSSLALVGGSPAGEIVRKLLDSKDADTRAAAAETCRHGIFGEETVTALGRRLFDPLPKVRRAAVRALALNANWRSEAAQQALIDLATHPEKAVEPSDRAGAVDALAYAARFQVTGVRQDPPVFQALVALLTDKDEEMRVMAANTLAMVRDKDFRGDLGRPEAKSPAGGWQQWLESIHTEAAGYLKDYEVCGRGAGVAGQDLYCTGKQYVATNPAKAFQHTLEAAEAGYVPAQAAIGMMYANGKGVEQNYAEARKWWNKAAEGGHSLAAANAAMVPGNRGARPANQNAAR